MAENTPQSTGKGRVDSRTLSRLFGLTTRRIQQLASDGVIPAIREKGGVNSYELLPAIRGYIDYLHQHIPEETPAQQMIREAEQRAREADADLKQTKAAIAGIELDELQRSMIPSDTVRDMTDDLILTITEELEKLPERMAKKLNREQDPMEVDHLIRKEVRDVLLSLSQYQYREADAEKRRKRHAGE